jgi:hypothetical protein
MSVRRSIFSPGYISHGTLSLFSWFIRRGRAAFDGRTCYWTHNIDQGARPCYPPSVKAVSHCCGVGSTCLGDTLCLSSQGPLYIGHCTARDWWNSTPVPDGCPKYYKYCEGSCQVLCYCIEVCNAQMITNANVLC